MKSSSERAGLADIISICRRVSPKAAGKSASSVVNTKPWLSCPSLLLLTFIIAAHTRAQEFPPSDHLKLPKSDLVSIFQSTTSSVVTTGDTNAVPVGFAPALRSRRVKLNKLAVSREGMRVGLGLRLDLFPDAAYTAHVDRVIESVSGTITLRGRIEGYPSGTVIITTSGERSLGVVDVPELRKRFLIQNETASESYYVIDVDLDRVDDLEGGPPLIPPVTRSDAPLPADNPQADPMDPITVDIMIVYTPAARAWADANGGGIANVIAQSLAKGQLALDNSGTLLTLNLVYSAEIAYTETGTDSQTDLGRLQASDDGFMDAVHTWRNQYSADLVSLFVVCSDVGGIGYLLNNPAGDAAHGFCLNRVQQASTSFTVIHEMGHNMGCGHAKAQNYQPGPGLFTYSAGWRWTGTNNNNYCSVMTYEAGTYFEDGITRTRVAHFSNPAILHLGAATGNAVDGDNARTIRESKGAVAAYRSLPANDLCNGARLLYPGAGFSMSTASATSTGDALPPCQVVFGKGVWFSFTPSSSAPVTVSTCGSDFDTVLAVFTGACFSLTQVACNDDNGPLCSGTRASVRFNGIAGTTYLILAGGFNGASGGLSIVADVITPRVLTVTSANPSSGVQITVSTNDNSGQGNGITGFARGYDNNTPVTLTAAATASGNNFQKWTSNGVDVAVSRTVTVTMNRDVAMTAVYGAADPGAPIVTITSPTSGNTWTTPSSRVPLRGEACGLVTNVTWANLTRGISGVATLNNTPDTCILWETPSISLNDGANTINVTARDSMGRTGSDSIIVAYDNATVTVTIRGTNSAWISSGSPSKNRSDGQEMWMGYDPTPQYLKDRSLLKFDLSTIPPGSTIHSATLGLYLSFTLPDTAPPSLPISCYRITNSWSQNSVTWNNQPGYSAPVGTLSVGSALDRRYWWDVGTIVSGWYSNTYPNYGVIFISAAEQSMTENERGFDGVARSDEPQLRVSYKPEADLPTITITQPTSAPSYSFTNPVAALQLGGSSSDNYGVVSVTWVNQTTSQSGSAAGTTSWSASVPLTNGYNSIVVIATDTADNHGTDAIMVFYAAPDTLPPSVPVNIAASNTSPNLVVITWDASTDLGGTGVQGYRIYRNGLPLGDTPFLQYYDGGVVPNSNYCYSVTAYDFASPSNLSAQSTQSCVAYLTPFITAAPTNTDAVSGATAVFVVAAGGSAPLSYQWSFNGDALRNGSAVSGATSSTLTLSNVNTNNQGSYSVKVSNLGGSTNVFASLAVLPIRPLFTRSVYQPDKTVELDLSCLAGWTYLIQASADLAHWRSVYQATAISNKLLFTDYGATNNWQFYRALGFTATNTVPHPADLNADFIISTNEMTNYGDAYLHQTSWPIPPSPINSVFYSRAYYLFRLGPAYHVDPSTNPPLCWVLGP